MDYNQMNQNYQTNIFSVASMFCGTISIFMCCTGILSVPAGALGILFAVLSKRLGRPMPSAGKTGIRLSCIGIFLGLAFLAYSIYLVMTEPEYQKMYLDTLQYYSQFYDNL